MSDTISQPQQARNAGVPTGEKSQELSVRRLGWAAYEIVTERGTRLVVDPYLHTSEGAHSGLPDSPITVDELAGADVVAVTHAGIDHRAQAIDIALAGDAILVSGPSLSKAAHDSGVPPERCGVMVSGCTMRYEDVTIKALDARHESIMTWNGQVLADQPMSFMITTTGGSRLFCGGDFSISGDMRVWRELFAPHVAILGIGGLRVGPVDVVELPPSDAAIAAEWLGVSHVIAVHHAPDDPAPERLKQELARRKSPIEVVALTFGETWAGCAGGCS